MIKALINPRCLREVLRLAGRSRKSITVVNYLGELSGKKDDPILEIAGALIGARKRGAAVSVVPSRATTPSTGCSRTRGATCGWTPRRR